MPAPAVMPEPTRVGTLPSTGLKDADLENQCPIPGATHAHCAFRRRLPFRFQARDEDSRPLPAIDDAWNGNDGRSALDRGRLVRSCGCGRQERLSHQRGMRVGRSRVQRLGWPIFAARLAAPLLQSGGAISISLGKSCDSDGTRSSAAAIPRLRRARGRSKEA